MYKMTVTRRKRTNRVHWDERIRPTLNTKLSSEAIKNTAPMAVPAAAGKLHLQIASVYIYLNFKN